MFFVFLDIPVFLRCYRLFPSIFPLVLAMIIVSMALLVSRILNLYVKMIAAFFVLYKGVLSVES